MSFVDTVITNAQRFAADLIEAPQTFVERSIGQVQEIVSGGVTIAGALGGIGAEGPRGERGLTTNIIVQPTGTRPGSATAQPVRDLSTFAGGFWSGGNGMFATRTTVERLEIGTGFVQITSRMPGSPHLMNSEINAAKKVFRRSAALQKRLPRKTVKESETTKLKNAAVAAATAAVSCPPQVCAPKC